MVLHIYNPEHDFSLACNQWNLSLPKAAKMTRERYWDVPLRWANPGDWILVESGERRGEREYHGVRLVTLEDLSKLTEEELPDRIEPWGWDRYIVNQLVSANKLLQRLCPTDEEIQRIREMSSRKFAAENLLPQLVAIDEGLIGESRVLELKNLETEELENCVLKSPWSCSGRGVRFIRETFTDSDRKWAEKIIREQGYIMQEPLYEKVLDFAMEFMYSGGRVEYCGLNVFETRNGLYVRNVKFQDVSESFKEFQNVLDKVRDKIISTLSSPLHFARRQKPTLHYISSFGVDMMIVKGNKLHPCVELNLRHTMGQGTVKSEK